MLYRLRPLHPRDRRLHRGGALGRAVPGHADPRPDGGQRHLRRDQHRAAAVEQHGMQRVAAADVVAGLGVRHDRQVGEARKLGDKVLLPAGDAREVGGGAGAAVRLGDGHAMLAHEAVEQGAHRVAALAALLFGRRHHLLDHGARQAFAGQRRHVAAVDPDMQAGQVGVPEPGHHQRGGQGGLAGGGAGQWKQNAADRHGWVVPG